MLTKSIRCGITCLFALALAAVPGSTTHAAPFGTSFTYQGELHDGGSPANGQYDLRFELFDDLVAGSQLGATLEFKLGTTVTVTDGLFSVVLDFGPEFNGDPRFLAIGVRPHDPGDAAPFTNLTPRRELNPVPYAILSEVYGGVGGPVVDTTVSEADLNLSHLGVVSSETGELVFSRWLGDVTPAVTRGRIVIVTGGTFGRGENIAGGSGTADISGCLTQSISLTGPGSRPWTYISDVVDWSACSSVDVTITADSAASPVIVRWIGLVPTEDDADADPANELNTGVALVGNTLEVTDAGGTLGADLSGLIDDGDWAWFSGTGLTGELTRSGDVALGAFTDPDGHGLNVQNYDNGKGAVRGADQSGSFLYAEGMLGVLLPSVAGWPGALVTNAGVFGIKPNEGGNGAAVLGWNNDDNSANYAGLFQTDGAGTDNYGVYAVAANGSGMNVGVYAQGGGNLQPDLVLGGAEGSNSTGYISSLPSDATSDLQFYTNDHYVIRLNADATADEDSDFIIQYDSLNNGLTTVFSLDDSGALVMQGSAVSFDLNQSDGTNGIILDAEDAGNGDSASISLYGVGGGRKVYIEANEISTEGAQIELFNTAGVGTIQLDAEFGVGGDGRITTEVLQITGGADLSEQFDVTTVEGLPAPEPGMVVCINPASPGELMVSSKAYDYTVAGIVSGAGDVKTGMIMGQRGFEEVDGQHAVALTGRVYVKADASSGAIRPGDLLTTSDLPGHAMKVTDHGRSQGAIIGKAMTALDAGQGLVLVLVSLQ